MRKRVRKKKRIGEFQELGFQTGFRFSNQLDNETRNNLIDRFYDNVIDNNGLEFGGGGEGTEWNGFAALEIRGSATDSHRQLVEQWYIQEPEVLEYYVLPLIDAFYGDFLDYENEWIEKRV